MFHGFDNVNTRDYLVVNQERSTRNNCFKIIGKSFRSEESKLFFFNRIVKIWNSLLAQVVNSNAIESFKARLDKYLSSNPSINYFAP